MILFEADYSQLISIHAPREGGDIKPHVQFMHTQNFNPRPPRGGRLNFLNGLLEGLAISIHAPREGGDMWSERNITRKKNFNPRPPRGGRQ